MASSAYLPSYQPYNSLQSAMNNFTGTPPSSSPVNGYGTSPLQYNMPLNQLRQQSDQTTLNQPQSSADRVRTMSDRLYERWKADSMFKDKVYTQFQDDVASATAGLDRSPNDFGAYKNYLSNSGAAGLFGGTVAPINQRMQDWNTQLFTNQKQQADALRPVYSQYGMMAPQQYNPQITGLQNPMW